MSSLSLGSDPVSSATAHELPHTFFADGTSSLFGGTERVVAFAVAIVLAAFLIGRGMPRSRVRLRRSVILFATYLVTRASAFLLAWGFSGGETLGGYFQAVTDVIEVLLIINLAAIFLFEVVLPKLRIELSAIVHDVSVFASYVVSALWLMHRAGFNPSSIVATSAVVTAVLGLSLQATLGNVLGGLALQFDDSIREGDWIELENKAQGQVREIRWRHTVVETRDWDTLIVPNSALLTQTIRVLGKRNNSSGARRMWVHFNVDFRHSPGLVIRTVTDALLGAPLENVCPDPQPQCICYDFARDGRDSFAAYAVRYWLVDLARDDWTNSLVRQRIYAALQRAQIPLAVPAATIFLSQDDEEHEERKRSRERGSHLRSLEGVVLFSRLSPDELQKLADRVRAAPFSKGEIMTRQGAPAHWLYVLTKGQAEVRVKTAQGVERNVAVIQAPSFFGEMALMTGEPREATVIALTDAECLRVDKTDFQEILRQRPEMAQEISTILAQRRVELLSARENLDAAAQSRKMVTERSRILASIREFFALGD